MGKATTCDGTGVEIDDDTPTTGLFGHQYSEEVRPVAEKYLEELNDLHTRTAVAFQEGLIELRLRYGEKLRQLPDDTST